MTVVRKIAEVRNALAVARRGGRMIGLVPTMGALHAGHMSLVESAKREGCFAIVSIFVNPTQFGPNEDYLRYPRNEAADLALCEQAGVDLVFVPEVREIYHPQAATRVRVARLTETLCGPHRPGHFEGVATVVAKLFNMVHPDRAYFGEKDAQQLAVVRRMVRDLDFPIEVVGCPIVREPDGLALSSRNTMLDSDARRQAASLHRALTVGRDRILSGERTVAGVAATMATIIQSAGPAQIDYISIVDPDSMQPVAEIDKPVLLAVAVRIGGVRLIDNVRVDPPR